MENRYLTIGAQGTRRMTWEKLSRRHWFWAGCTLTTAASLALMVFPLLPERSIVGDYGVLSLAGGLAVLMACGATLAVFSLKRP